MNYTWHGYKYKQRDGMIRFVFFTNQYRLDIGVKLSI
jgi:hypothetical protein